MVNFAGPTVASEDECAAAIEKRTKSCSSASIARTMTSQSPSSASKKLQLQPKSLSSSSPDPQTRKEKFAHEPTHLSPLKCTFLSENCNPNVKPSGQAFCLCSASKLASGMEAEDHESICGRVAGRSQSTNSGKAIRESHSNLKSGVESAIRVSPRKHFCRSTRCAANDPDYAVPNPMLPRKFLISKKHLLQKQDPTICKCCLAGETGVAGNNEQTTKKNEPCVCRVFMPSNPGQQFKCNSEIRSSPYPGGDDGGLSREEHRMQPECLPSQSNETFANPTTADASMIFGKRSHTCPLNGIEVESGHLQSAEEEHSRLFVSANSSSCCMSTLEKCDGWAEKRPSDIQSGPYHGSRAQSPSNPLLSAREIQAIEFAVEPAKSGSGEDHLESLKSKIENDNQQSKIDNYVLLFSGTEEISSHPVCSSHYRFSSLQSGSTENLHKKEYVDKVSRSHGNPTPSNLSQSEMTDVYAREGIQDHPICLESTLKDISEDTELNDISIPFMPESYSLPNLESLDNRQDSASDSNLREIHSHNILADEETWNNHLDIESDSKKEKTSTKGASGIQLGSLLPDTKGELVFFGFQNLQQKNNLSNFHTQESRCSQSRAQLPPTCLMTEENRELYKFTSSISATGVMNSNESEEKDNLEGNESRLNVHPPSPNQRTEGSLTQQVCENGALLAFNTINTVIPALQNDEPPLKKEKIGNSTLNSVIEAFQNFSPSRESRVKTLVKTFESLISCPKSEKQTSKADAVKFCGHVSFHIQESKEQADDLQDSQPPLGENNNDNSHKYVEADCVDQKGNVIKMNDSVHYPSKPHMGTMGYDNFKKYCPRGEIGEYALEATDVGDRGQPELGSTCQTEHDYLDRETLGGSFKGKRMIFENKSQCPVSDKGRSNIECNIDEVLLSKRFKGNFSSPQPFKLRTEERGMIKEQEFAKKVEKLFSDDERLRIPVARGLPWTTDEPEILPKPHVKEPTKPVDLHLFTATRALERADFDEYITEKLCYIEQQKLEVERLQKIAEEEEIKRMRKDMIPRAQLMPYFDRPFKPRRSSKRPTVPKEPKIHHHTQAKRAKCMFWDGVQSSW